MSIILFFFFSPPFAIKPCYYCARSVRGPLFSIYHYAPSYTHVVRSGETIRRSRKVMFFFRFFYIFFYYYYCFFFALRRPLPRNDLRQDKNILFSGDAVPRPHRERDKSTRARCGAVNLFTIFLPFFFFLFFFFSFLLFNLV